MARLLVVVLLGVAVLGACEPDEGGAESTPVPVASRQPFVPVVSTPRPATPRPPEPNLVYYDNCDAVRAAGKAPLRPSDPGYRPGLDRDNDGLACE